MNNDYITAEQRLIFTRPHDRSDRYFKVFLACAAMYFLFEVIRSATI